MSLTLLLTPSSRCAPTRTGVHSLSVSATPSLRALRPHGAALIPFDIVCQFAHATYSSAGRSGLLVLMQVARAFSDACIPLLYKTIVLDTEVRMAQFATFAEHHETRNRLLRHVRHLSPWRDYCRTDQVRAGKVISACKNATHVQTTLNILLNFCHRHRHDDKDMNQIRAPETLFVWADSTAWGQMLGCPDLSADVPLDDARNFRGTTNFSQTRRLHVAWLEFEHIMHDTPTDVWHRVFCATHFPALEVFSTGWTRDVRVVLPRPTSDDLTSDTSASVTPATLATANVTMIPTVTFLPGMPGGVIAECPIHTLTAAVLSLPALHTLIYRVPGSDIGQLRAAFTDPRQHVLDADACRMGSDTNESNLQMVWLNDVEGRVSMWSVDDDVSVRNHMHEP